MPVLNGYGAGIAPQMVMTTAAPAPGAPSATGAVGAMDGRNTSAVIDGTPVRVVVLCLAAAAGLFALKMAGLRFSVGASA